MFFFQNPSSLPLYVVVIISCCILPIVLGTSVACVILHKFLNKRQKSYITSRESNEIQSPDEPVYEEVQLENMDETVRVSSNVAYGSVVNAPQ